MPVTPHVLLPLLRMKNKVIISKQATFRDWPPYRIHVLGFQLPFVLKWNSSAYHCTLRTQQCESLLTPCVSITPLHSRRAETRINSCVSGFCFYKSQAFMLVCLSSLTVSYTFWFTGFIAQGLIGVSHGVLQFMAYEELIRKATVATLTHQSIKKLVSKCHYFTHCLHYELN